MADTQDRSISMSDRWTRAWTASICTLAAAAAVSILRPATLPGAETTSGTPSETSPVAPGVDAERYESTVARAIDFLINTGQAEDGSYSRQVGTGVTALATTALLRHGRTADDPAVARGLKCLEAAIQPDGGVYPTDSMYRNYETCLAIVCFQEANHDGRYDQIIAKADAFVKGLQWDESEDKDPSDFAYGGAGYGRHQRPDLSNTSFLLDALVAAGNDEDSEAIQRALIFVSRCQNLESEHNKTPFSARVQDGGFYYTPAAGGTSQAGNLPNGGLRSYGSMTYAGLKSMIYAGVGPEDPRVKAAVQWLGKHYDLDTNPGMGNDGLYYYYHTFAKALDAFGQDTFVDEQGRQHNWRDELVEKLASLQKEDGSWINESPRWLEADPNLSTAYCLLALSYCKPTGK
jgi:squalene-hopene/tetraprenyl-beta-curcumene cyclase